MSEAKRIIGLHFPMFIDRGYRLMDGALHYVGQHPGLAARDFSYFRNEAPSADPPPWLNRADGIVMEAGEYPGLMAWLAQGRVSVVNTAADLLDKSIPAAFVDQASVARLAAEHLTGLGHERFWHIGYGIGGVARLRRDALKREFRQRRLPLQIFEIAELLPLDPAGAIILPDRIRTALSKELAAATRPLGIFALNDDWGRAICELLAALGWRIPDDAAVLSVGDSNRARTCTPPLSAIRAPSEQIGYEAARMVHRLIEGKRLAKRQLPVPATEVVARESTIGTRSSMPPDVDRALELISRHACEGIRVEDVVRQMRVPMRTLKMRFGQAVGRSMGEELRNVRLARAKELLSTTELSLTRIAGLIGYNDSAHFTHFFRQHAGLPPSEYRRQRR